MGCDPSAEGSGRKAGALDRHASCVNKSAGHPYSLNVEDASGKRPPAPSEHGPGRRRPASLLGRVLVFPGHNPAHHQSMDYPLV